MTRTSALRRFGKAMAGIRRERRLRQREMAAQLGIAVETISRWENGHYVPRRSLRLKLDHWLGMSLEQATGINPADLPD
jgi:transcriptional regulator with XRE-family HTH domain